MKLFRYIVPIVFLLLSFIGTKGQCFVEPKYDTLMFDQGILTLAVFDENGVMRTKIIKKLRGGSRCHFFDEYGRVVLKYDGGTEIHTYSYADSLIVEKIYESGRCSGVIECYLPELTAVIMQYVKNGVVYKEQHFDSRSRYAQTYPKRHGLLQLFEETEYYENGVIKKRVGGFYPSESERLPDGRVIVKMLADVYSKDTNYIYYDADGYEIYCIDHRGVEKIITYNDTKTEKLVRYINPEDASDRGYHIYKYDTQGRLIEEEFGNSYFGPNKKTPSSKKYYAYNDKNQLLWERGDAVRLYNSEYQYEYNKYGGVSRKILIHKKDTIEYFIYSLDKEIHFEGQFYVYKFDTLGRIVEDAYGTKMVYKQNQIQSRYDMNYYLSKIRNVYDYDVDGNIKSYKGEIQYQETDTGYIKITPSVGGSKEYFYYDKNLYLIKHIQTYDSSGSVYEYDKNGQLYRGYQIRFSKPFRLAYYYFDDEIQEVQRKDTTYHRGKMFVKGYDSVGRHIQTLVYEYDSLIYEPWYKSYCVDFYYDKKNRVERKVLSVESYSKYVKKNLQGDEVEVTVETPFLKNTEEETYTKKQRRKRTKEIFSSFGDYELQ